MPTITPFTTEGNLDEAAVVCVIDHLLEGGVAGVSLLGTTGEAPSISPDIRLRLVALAVEHIDGRAVVYAGISSNCLDHSVDGADAYMRAGADVLVAHLPSHYTLDGAEQRSYYEALAGQISGSLLIYNISSTTRMAVPIDVVEALSKNPRVVGVKDSDDNTGRLEELLHRLGSAPDFSILVGVTALSARVMRLGADGFVPSAGNLAPDLCRSLYRSAVDGEKASSQVYQQKLLEVAGIYRNNCSLAQSLGLLKAAMGALSLCGPTVLPPLPTPQGAQQEAVRSAFLRWLTEQWEQARCSHEGSCLTS